MTSKREKFASPGELSLVCGAGGSRAILGSSGAILAAHAMGIERWQSIGGVSGGSIPALMLAAGVQPAEIVRKVIEIDFNSMLTPHANLLRIWWAFFRKECAWKKRATHGVLTSEKLGQLVESYAPSWPENYWTVAVTGRRQLLFTAQGVFEYSAATGKRLLTSEPAPLGLAVRATCAVPGVMKAVPYGNMQLLDGALADEGRCPAALPAMLLGAKTSNTVACDVGEGSIDELKNEHWFWKGMRYVVCGNCCAPDDDKPVDTSGGVTLVRPTVTKVQSLEFTLSPDQKWEAMMAGFIATVSAFREAGLVSEVKLKQALELSGEFEFIQQTAMETGDLSSSVQTMLAGAGLV
jgi:predicted acylesterase/phospholipase RssA